MVGKITGGQWTVLEHLAQADRSAETVRQTWVPVGGAVDGEAVRVLEWAGLCRTVPAGEVLRVGAFRPARERAARITPEGLDAVAWRHGRTDTNPPCPAWSAKASDPAYREIALRPHEMMLLRRYAHLVPDLTGAPAAAGTLWEALIEARHSPCINRWHLQLDDTGLAGLAHAAHLEALTGSVTVRNRLYRAYGLTHPHPVSVVPFAEATAGTAGREQPSNPAPGPFG